MKNFISAIGAIVLMATFVGLLALGILHHSGALDAHKLHRAITGKLVYPDNLFGGHGR